MIKTISSLKRLILLEILALCLGLLVTQTVRAEEDVGPMGRYIVTQTPPNERGNIGFQFTPVDPTSAHPYATELPANLRYRPIEGMVGCQGTIFVAEPESKQTYSMDCATGQVTSLDRSKPGDEGKGKKVQKAPKAASGSDIKVIEGENTSVPF